MRATAPVQVARHDGPPTRFALFPAFLHQVPVVEQQVLFQPPERDTERFSGLAERTVTLTQHLHGTGIFEGALRTDSPLLVVGQPAEHTFPFPIYGYLREMRPQLVGKRCGSQVEHVRNLRHIVL